MPRRKGDENRANWRSGKRRSPYKDKVGGFKSLIATTGTKRPVRMIRRVSFSLLTTTAESKTRTNQWFHVKHPRRDARTRIRRPTYFFPPFGAQSFMPGMAPPAISHR